MYEIPDSVMMDALNKAIEVLIRKYDELGMRATGKWAEGLEAVMDGKKGIIKGFDYTEYLAKGRPPNTNQSDEAKQKWAGWAGNTFIKDWVKAKGLNIDPFAVARKIANEGTTWYQQGGSDLLEVLEHPDVIETFYREIGSYLRVTIANELIRELKELAA